MFRSFTTVGNKLLAICHPSLGDSTDLIWGLLQLFIDTRRKVFVLFRWRAACLCQSVDLIAGLRSVIQLSDIDTTIQ